MYIYLSKLVNFNCIDFLCFEIINLVVCCMVPKKLIFYYIFLMLKKRLDLGNLYLYDKLKSVDLIKIVIYISSTYIKMMIY